MKIELYHKYYELDNLHEYAVVTSEPIIGDTVIYNSQMIMLQWYWYHMGMVLGNKSLSKGWWLLPYKPESWGNIKPIRTWKFYDGSKGELIGKAILKHYERVK